MNSLVQSFLFHWKILKNKGVTALWSGTFFTMCQKHFVLLWYANEYVNKDWWCHCRDRRMCRKLWSPQAILNPFPNQFIHTQVIPDHAEVQKSYEKVPSEMCKVTGEHLCWIVISKAKIQLYQNHTIHHGCFPIN